MEASTSRKITVNLYMTLDGYGEFPKYPGSDVVHRDPSDAWKEMWPNRYVTVDMLSLDVGRSKATRTYTLKRPGSLETLPTYSNSHGGSTEARRFSYPIL